MVTPDDDDDVENHAERVKNEKLSLSLSLIGSDRIGSDRCSAVFLSRFSVLRRRLREIVVPSFSRRRGWCPSLSLTTMRLIIFDTVFGTSSQ